MDPFMGLRIISNYGDGSHPDVRIGNETLQDLKVRPQFYSEFNRSADASWYLELLNSPEIMTHSTECPIEIKGRCLQYALFPELRKSSPSCGHGSFIEFTPQQRNRIFSGVSEAILTVADLSPSIDLFLSSGKYQINGADNKTNLIVDSSKDVIERSITARLKELQDSTTPFSVGSVIKSLSCTKSTSIDQFSKELARAQALILKTAALSEEDRFIYLPTKPDSESYDRFQKVRTGNIIHQMMDEDGACEMAISISNLYTSHHGKNYGSRLKIEETAVDKLYQKSDYLGAILLCMSDVAATCARVWYQTQSYNSPSERIRSLVQHFKVVQYNGEIIKSSGTL